MSPATSVIEQCTFYLEIEDTEWLYPQGELYQRYVRCERTNRFGQKHPRLREAPSDLSAHL